MTKFLYFKEFRKRLTVKCCNKYNVLQYSSGPFKRTYRFLNNLQNAADGAHFL